MTELCKLCGNTIQGVEKEKFEDGHAHRFCALEFVKDNTDIEELFNCGEMPVNIYDRFNIGYKYAMHYFNDYKYGIYKKSSKQTSLRECVKGDIVIVYYFDGTPIKDQYNIIINVNIEDDTIPNSKKFDMVPISELRKSFDKDNVIVLLPAYWTPYYDSLFKSETSKKSIYHMLRVVDDHPRVGDIFYINLGEEDIKCEVTRVYVDENIGMFKNIQFKQLKEEE